VDERIAVLKEMGGLDDEVAEEEDYRTSLIENCWNLKVRFLDSFTQSR
jgi:hypothetical protein